MSNPSFLGDLSDQISSQFSLGENTTHTLDSVVDGQNAKYGSLGDFASKFDQSAQRRYMEEGYLRRDPYNTDPKQQEILWQEPEATVLIKKRMFSSIAENYRPDFMDSDEKLYYKAMRILFQNKCNQIAALEKLSKIQKITSSVGQIDTQLIPWIISLTDTVNNGFADGTNLFGILGNNNPFSSQDAGQFIKIVDRLRTLYAYNMPNPVTTWITDSTNLFQSTLGQGTGTIEITNFTNLNTMTSVDLQTPGNFNLNISDPYKAMVITDFDIEKSLSDATNSFYNKKSFQFGLMSAEQVIADTQQQLNSAREIRKASPITFKIDPDTLLGKRVTAIIDRLALEIPFTYDTSDGTGFPGIGGAGGVGISGNDSVSVPDSYLRNGDIAGFDGLDTKNTPLGPDSNIKRLVNQSELDMFQNLVSAIFNKLQMMANSAGNFTTMNKFTNYARRKLLANFAGKLIIQPMDVIHIYISSKSRFDNKILGGLQQMFSGVGILQNFNNTITDYNNSFDALFRPAGSVTLQAEKNMYAGADFPNFLWTLMRSQFVTEKEGTHVFGGVIDSVNQSWSDGKFTVDVSGKDNTAYFDQGKVNFKPGVDAFNGLIFDPLTPFKSNFDTISSNSKTNTLELLDENKYLLSESGKDALLRYKLGPSAGERATQGNYLQDKSIDPITGRLVKVFYAPDGLVYKWKEGIGVFTQFGSTSQLNDPNLVGNANTFQEPFAGLDVMNVLSLLVTGVPYNFATYFKVTSNLNGISGDPQSKQNASYSFINSLRTDLSKRNALWGNFIPFKNLTMNESAIAQAMKAQMSINNINQDLDNKLQSLVSLQQKAMSLGAVNALSQKIPGIDFDQSLFADVKAQVDNLTTDIQNSIDAIQEQNNQFYSQANIDPSTEGNNLIDGKNDPSDSSARKTLRKQINYLTRRMSYDVRGNQDKNLFIVDDYYDIDYDIAAFNQALSDGIKLYNNEFTSVREKIINVANLLNLEVFCDTQGHIRVRSPQYNRMPSSVFYRMMYLKQTLGIQIFPEFLNTMFGSQLDTLRERIEILEDEIRLDCAILGKKTSIDSDDETIEFINYASSIIEGMGGTFSFISSPSGTISDIAKLLAVANHDVADAGISQNLTDYNKIKAAGTSTKIIFGNSARYSVLFQTLKAQNQTQAGQNVTKPINTSILSSSLVQQLISRINTKSGQHISSKDYLVKSGPNSPLQIDNGQTIDFLKVTQDITNYIQEWQSVIKLFYHTIKNAAEYKSLDDDKSTANNLITPGLFNNSNIPEVYEHMIEDESYDDYGLGSGKRYIIKNSQIRNLRLSENPPPYTTVEVQGVLNPFAPNSLPEGLNSFPGGGNGLVTAIAIDYDLWRNYGFKEPAVVRVPFLSDPESQCAPYASIILSRNRANIFRGSVTIAGNEFMQPGEIIYLEDRNMLFYVTSVRHALSEGSSFNTTLELSYGHAPGVYIPTYMDSIGKLIYKNREIASTIVQRQDSSGPDSNLGIIQIDGRTNSPQVFNTGSETDSINSFSAANSQVINNILYNTAYIINKNDTPGNNIKASVELRIYYDDSTPVNNALSKFAKAVRQQLTGESDGPKISAGTNQVIKNPTLDTKSVNIINVNVHNDTQRRSPSQQAISSARDQVQNVSSTSPTGNNNTNTDVLRKALFSYIIDCWVSYERVSSEISSNSTSQPITG